MVWRDRGGHTLHREQVLPSCDINKRVQLYPLYTRMLEQPNQARRASSMSSTGVSPERVREAAIEAITHLEQLQVSAASAAPPCWTCRFGGKRAGFSWTQRCMHPFLRRGVFEPQSGRTVWSFQDQVQARRGVCGLEGRLYESAPAFCRTWRRVYGGWWMLIPVALSTEVLLLWWAH